MRLSYWQKQNNVAEKILVMHYSRGPLKHPQSILPTQPVPKDFMDSAKVAPKTTLVVQVTYLFVEVIGY